MCNDPHECVPRSSLLRTNSGLTSVPTHPRSRNEYQFLKTSQVLKTNGLHYVKVIRKVLNSGSFGAAIKKMILNERRMNAFLRPYEKIRHYSKDTAPALTTPKKVPWQRDLFSKILELTVFVAQELLLPIERVLNRCLRVLNYRRIFGQWLRLHLQIMHRYLL